MQKEARFCACGNEFTAFIKVANGKDILDGFYTCNVCRGKDRELKRKAERLAQIPKLQELQLDLWQSEYNLPNRFALKTFDDFDKKLQPKAFEIMTKYSYHWIDDNPPRSIVLLSPDIYGVGKTHLVAALLNKIVETDEKGLVRKDGTFRKNHCPVYFIAENVLLSRIRQTFNRSNKHNDDEFYEDTEEDIYQKLDKYDLLVIDDVGKVRPRDYSFLQGVYFRIIDSRYSNEMPVILTTNLSFTELENHIGGACADRLREMCGNDNFLVMKGASYRQRGPI